ncbi:methylenetetrahydrofolate reductase [NAD(P)H] [Aestuariivirga sp.]|jgi:methylenetetrahydrofolate reductase (NADPH)|uniref:methylenetetrahydrofolate reductase [NAD(P)H] n=1 Tax=Aestuariivirga sp. TaxID=2650926 RepID=UPI00378345A5
MIAFADDVSGLSVSFEFFPPKSPDDDSFWRTIRRLETVGPEFVSVTYGAGGTTRDRTLATVRRIASETRLKPAAHLTCVGASRAEVDATILEFAAAGVRHILALRGDPPAGVGAKFTPHPDGYRNAADLVRGIRELGDFEVSVSAYPERHPDSVSIEEDLAFMADKAEHGASRAISQFFFHNAFFLRLRDRIAARGINIELVPGILPITSFARVSEFAAKCGAHVPPALARRFEGLDDDPDTRNLVAAMVAAEQVDQLRREGVTHFHFYTLNRADLVYAICRVLGLGVRAQAA